MKPSFHARLLNGPFDDPCLYVRIVREGMALMFDAGFTVNLSARDILKTTDIFISHTHIDHFIGFDNILRVSLKKETPLRFYGPEGFTDRIEGKLRSYTWNLIGDYPLVLEVSEVTDKFIKRASFKAQNYFKREESEAELSDSTIMKGSFFRVSAAILDHQVQCLAFSLDEDFHINIDKDKLDKMNLPVGPWLGEFKKAIREGLTDSVFSIKGKSRTFAELREIANITKGQKISYVVDALGSKENIRKIIELVKGSDVLYIETFFMDKDKDRAKERCHLTAKMAGSIARDAGVGRIEPVHFSPRYIDEPEALIKEAEEEFTRQL
ncbi:MAG: ribonuclease Z [Nitrospirae bacterium]|nr:ribonuclease Z [Nitrospirota bacterium]